MKSFNSKLYKALGLAVMALTLVTCKTSGGGDVDITITPDQVYALPVSAQSCSSQYGGGTSGGSGTTTGSNDLAAPTLSFSRIRINWASSSLLQIAYIQLTFTSPSISGGSFTCYLANTELTTVFYGSDGAGTTGRSEVVIDPTSSTSIDNYSNGVGTGCPIRCGSIPLNNQHAPAYVTGTATVIGVAIDSNGNETPAQGQTTVSFQWQALP